MSAEFGFEVGVAEDALFGVELLTVEAEEAAVEREGAQEVHGWRAF